jgi:hypothetical protein
MPVALLTVLSINERVKDCAAYEGIVPTQALEDSEAVTAEKVRAGGNKISKSDALELFPEISEMGLRYRR